MKKLHLISFGTCLLIIFLTAACKKDKGPDTHQEKVEQITDGPWNIVFRGYDVNQDGVFQQDDPMENALAECQLDDTFEFKADGSYTLHPNTATNGCGTGSYTSSWKLHANEADFSFDEIPGRLLKLNDSTFQFKLTMEDGLENMLIFRR